MPSPKSFESIFRKVNNFRSAPDFKVCSLLMHCQRTVRMMHLLKSNTANEFTSWVKLPLGQRGQSSKISWNIKEVVNATYHFDNLLIRASLILPFFQSLVPKHSFHGLQTLKWQVISEHIFRCLASFFPSYDLVMPFFLQIFFGRGEMSNCCAQE